MFSLYTVPDRQSVRDELQPRAGAAQASTSTTSCRTAAACSNSRRTASSTSSRTIPVAEGKGAASSRSTACPSENVRAVRRAVLHDAPPAAPPHLAGAARRRAEQLCGQRDVPVAVEPAGDRRHRARARAERALPRVEPASRRPASGRRSRRRFLPGRRHLGAASLRGRPDQAARIAGRHGAKAASTRRHSARPQWKLDQLPVAQPSRHRSTATRRTAPGALREMLALFTDISDIVSEQRIRGIEGVSSRPIVRRLRQKNGFNAARGIEITVHVRREGVRGHRHLPARRRPRPLLCRIHFAQQLHRDGDRDPSSAAW